MAERRTESEEIMKEDKLDRLRKKLFHFSCGIAGLQSLATVAEMDGPLWHRAVAAAVRAGAAVEIDPFDDSSDYLIKCYEEARKAMTEAHYLLRIIQKLGFMPDEKGAKELVRGSKTLMGDLNFVTRTMKEFEAERERARYDEFAESMKEAMEAPEEDDEA